jgi:hypothetical protein
MRSKYTMTVDIKLRSGLVLRNAVGMLVEKFRQWPWDKYDGEPPLNRNVIDPGRDVDRVYRLGSRTPRNAYLTLIQFQGKRISSCLRRIPTDVALEDIDLQSLKSPVVKLFDIMLGGKHVKMAGATKLLYPFRPALLPVIDSVVEYYYWYAASIRDEPRYRRLSSISGWGEYIFELISLMRDDVISARAAIDKTLAACEGHEFCSASRVRVLESLIWHYYARAGVVASDSDE